MDDHAIQQAIELDKLHEQAELQLLNIALKRASDPLDPQAGLFAIAYSLAKVQVAIDAGLAWIGECLNDACQN
jgi:hypothetical protein